MQRRAQQMVGRVAVAAKRLESSPEEVCSDFSGVDHVQQQRTHVDPCAYKPVNPCKQNHVLR
jgi:hypothetical protein